MTFLEKFRKISGILAVIAVLFILPKSAFAQGPEIELKFIDSRMTTIGVDGGKQLTIWKTTDKELLDSGVIATTEETAMVVRTYLAHYRIFQKQSSLDKAQEGLEFLFYMQDKDGRFYRYLDKNGHLDTQSQENRPTLREPGAMAFIAIAEGIFTFKSGPASEYKKMETAFLKTADLLKAGLKNPEHPYGTYKDFQKLKLPAWLTEDRGDLSAMYLYGLTRFYQKHPYGEIKETAKMLADGICQFKFTEPDSFPRQVHLSFVSHPGLWKTENAMQTTALALAGKVFDRESWLAEAREEGIGFLVHLISSYGPIDGYYPHPDITPQTPLGAYTLTLNLATLARIDNNDQLMKVAGLSGAWFYRNNPSGHALYNNHDGSCFEAVRGDKITENRSLMGACCANLTLMELYRTHGFNYLGYREEKVHTYQVMDSETGRPVNTDFEVSDWEYSHGGKGKVVIIRRRNTFWHKFKVDEEDDYFLLMSYQKQLMYSSAVAVNVRVDGGPILLVPLGGAQGEPYMIMQRVMEPVRLMEGLHTVGVRYKGLLFTLPAIIDCTVIQPVLERRWFVNDTGRTILLIKNLEPSEKRMKISEYLKKKEIIPETTGISGQSRETPLKEAKGKYYLHVPPSGFGTIEW